MKFLECPKLLALTNALSGANLGDRIVHGRIEAYSCKNVKAEKALSKEIEKELLELTTSPVVGPAKVVSSPTGGGGVPLFSLSGAAMSGGPTGSGSGSSGSGSGATPSATGAAAAVMGGIPGSVATPSPLGPLNSTATRRLLVSLITTMNASFPDYDFSNLRPEQFEHETNRFFVQNSINNVLLNGMEQIQPGFREAVWRTIDENIEIDKCEIYSYTPEPDSDLGLGNLWAIFYFFFNKKKKNLIFFSSYAVSKMRGNKPADTFDDDDIDTNNDMDDDDIDNTETGPVPEPENNLALDWDELNMEASAAGWSKISSSLPTTSSISMHDRSERSRPSTFSVAPPSHVPVPPSTSVPASPYYSAPNPPLPGSMTQQQLLAIQQQQQHSQAQSRQRTLSATATPSAAPSPQARPVLSVTAAAAAAAAAVAAPPSSSSAPQTIMMHGNKSMSTPQQRPANSPLQQPQPQPLLSLGGTARGSNSFTQSAALQQQQQQQHAAAAAAMQKSQSQPRTIATAAAAATSNGRFATPNASPAASPLIRPAQPQHTALPPSAMASAANAATILSVSRQRSAPAAAVAATNGANLHFSQLSQLATAPLNSTAANAASQSMGIPLLQPIGKSAAAAAVAAARPQQQLQRMPATSLPQKK